MIYIYKKIYSSREYYLYSQSLNKIFDNIKSFCKETNIEINEINIVQ